MEKKQPRPSPRTVLQGSSSDAPRTKGIEYDEEQGIANPETVPLLFASQLTWEGGAEVSEQGGQDILMFSAPVYNCVEADTYVVITVLRYGKGEGACSASYSAWDITSKNSMDYLCKPNTIVFADGEFSKSFQVDVKANEEWTHTKIFTIHITDAKNCRLDDRGNKARVYIINKDPFPAPEFASFDSRRSFSVAYTFPLFLAFCAFMFRNAGIAWVTLTTIVLDQLKTIVLFGNMWVGMYIVDTLFERDHDSSHNHLLLPDRYHTAILVASWYIVPRIVTHCWDTIRCRFDMGGHVREFLQVGVISKYLELNQASVDKIDDAQLSSLLDGSSKAAESYVAGISVFAAFGKMGAIAIFLLIYQPHDVAVFWLLLILPALLVINGLRLYSAAKAVGALDERERDMDAATSRVCKNRHLVKHYRRQPLMVRQFAKRIQNHSIAKRAHSMIQNNTEYMTLYLLGLVVFLYMVTNASAVISRDLSLGIFVTTVSIFTTYLVDAFEEFNNQCNIIVEALVSVGDITSMLNMPTEFLDNLERDQYRAFTMESEFQKIGSYMRTCSGRLVQATDLSSEILLSNVSFAYAGVKKDEEPTVILRNANLRIDRGKMTSIVGPHGSGKSTLLDLLADIREPTKGSIFVPPHLRILHVSREHMFFGDSMLLNLVMGLPGHGFDIKMRRVFDILTMLDLQEAIPIVMQEYRQLTQTDCHEGIVFERITLDKAMLTAKSSTDGVDARWLETSSASFKQKLHLARAFIADPDVMILHHSLQAFNQDVGTRIIGVLRQFVDQKGLGLDANAPRVHKKTVIFTTTRPSQAFCADVITEIDPETKTISVVSHEEYRKRWKLASQQAEHLSTEAGRRSSPSEIGSSNPTPRDLSTPCDLTMPQMRGLVS